MNSLIKSIVVCIFVYTSSCVNPPEPRLIFTSYNYLVILPQNYAQQDGCPLIYYLHGRGGGDMTTDDFKSYGLGEYLTENQDSTFIVVAPLTPGSTDWYVEALNNVLELVIKQYKVDKKRIYLTGYSMGGNGVYVLACAYPEKFAAIAPAAGWGEPENACNIINLPIWVFHDSGDPDVKYSLALDMIEAIEDCGSSVRTTIYNNNTHFYWTEVYQTQELYDWFLSYTNER